jgi:uncharacterized membrane protein
MARRSSRQPLRSHLPLAPTIDPYFRWRGTGVSRLEGLADAVFAFTVTLLVVALEVPRDFESFKIVLESFPAFAATFVVLMLFWNDHYTFFRRYGLEDTPTQIWNTIVLLLVVFMAYPLKFLFASGIAAYFGLGEGVFEIESMRELSWLYKIYGLGLGGLWFSFFMLYRHAWKRRDQLKLSATERIVTQGTMAEMLANLIICLGSIILASFERFAWQPGLVYVLIGPAMWFLGWRTGRQARASLKADKRRRRQKQKPTTARSPAVLPDHD